MTQSNPQYTDLNDNGLLDLDVYFDFLCPFSFQASQWVMQISQLMGSDVMSVRWKFFSLEQNARSGQDAGWKIWEQKSGGEVKGLLPFLAGSAAHARGGEAALGAFYNALGKMRHEEGLPIWEPQHIQQAWQQAGLDPAALTGVLDGSERSGYEKLQHDHLEAIERYGAFGTPTLVFEEHRAFYLKLMPRPTEMSEALELFQHVQRMAMGFKGGVLEFKQPMTPAAEQKLREMINNPASHTQGSEVSAG